MKFLSLHYLRGAAAILVVLFHASISLLGDGAALVPVGSFVIAVDIFFVISGFVMFYTTKDSTITPIEFFLRRIIRVFPIYFILTTLAFLIAVFFPNFTGWFSSNVCDYIMSILFIPYPGRFYHVAGPELSQGWTLNFEMFFYLVFSVTLFANSLTRLLMCIGTFLVFVLLGILFPSDNILWVTYTNSLTLEFTSGVLIAYTVSVRPQYMSHLLCMFGSIALIALVCSGVHYDVPRLFLFGMPAALIVAAAIQLERHGWVRNIPLLLILGDSSYSLYLTHTFLLSVLRRSFLSVLSPHLVSTHLLFMAVVLVVAVLVGYAFYKTVELPITKGLMKWLRAREGKQLAARALS